MHRSRLVIIGIDCDESTMEAGTRFWSQALGMPEEPPANPDSPYVGFRGTVGPLSIEAQRIGGASRIHLDIESDDVEAEVQRLEELGARRKEFIRPWWVMEDPAGMLFCVVPQVSKSLNDANLWNGAVDEK